MAPMAVARHDDNAAAVAASAAIPRHRQFAYARRREQGGPPSPGLMHLHARAGPNATLQLDQLPPLPVSPRWDSLSHSARFILQQSASRPNSPLDSRPHSPLPYDGSSIASDSCVNSPTFPLASKSSLADLRAAEGFPVENFSRPRKQSIRQPITDPFANQPRSAGLPPADPYLELTSAPQPPPWHRPRGPSVSSNQSASTFSSALPPTNADFYDPRPPRVRNPNNGLASSSRAPPLSYNNRIDSVGSNSTNGISPPWMSGEERSSFRSQLTESTAPGTAITERSSVLTKNSSVNSFYANPDEPSLEDVMGMYEKGFGDDESEIEDPTHSRPVTSASEPQRYSTSFVDMNKDEAEQPLPEDATNLDAEIRKSKMIFFSSAFTSSVPHIAENMARNNVDKRDSAKSMESEPSINSRLAPSPTPDNASDRDTPSPSPASERNTPDHSPIREARTPEPMPREISTPTLSPITTSPTRITASPTPITPITPTPAPQPVEVEEPGARDRYGFKKQNQYVTREQYDTWNTGYTEYLARRRRKWVQYLKDNALMTDRPNRFPAPSNKTKRFIRKGIPPDWRGAAWFYYAGGPAILAKHSGLYDKLVCKEAKPVDAEAIERDLHRTFPDNVQFKPPNGMETAPGSERSSQSSMDDSTQSANPPRPVGTEGEPPIITSLRRVLHAFSVYNPRIGYCQSLNFIAGLLLLFVENEEQCFWLLNVITRIYLPGTHEMSLEGSKVDLGVLMTELRDTMPAVWDKIGGELEADPTARPTTSKSIRLPGIRRRDLARLSTDRLPPITLCMTAWFMSCFIGTLPIETTLRVWDVFFYEGSKTLFRIALAIFKLGENEVKSVADPMEMFGVVQGMPRRLIDANAVMEATFKRRNGFGHLTQDDIDVKREERRHKAEQDRLRQAKTSDSWNVTSSDAEVTRKATFPLKKRRPTAQG